MKSAFAYVEPGSGFVFLQSSGTFLWLIVLFIFGFLGFFIKLIWHFFRKILWILIIFAIILILIGLNMSKGQIKQRVVILGFDAFDPSITEKLLQQKKLPNLFYLKQNGNFSPIKTTFPAESNVCWTSIATGKNPAKHGIFDFVMRNPSNYQLYLGLNEISLNKKVRIHKKIPTFWDILSKYKIPCYIYFFPNTYPAQRIYGKMLSGMGVPCLYGTMGRFSFYTTKNIPEEKIKESRGKIIRINPENKTIFTYIYGPKIETKMGIQELRIPLEINILPEKDQIILKFQKNRFYLKKGFFSKWYKIYYNIGPFKKIYGIVRFYLKSIQPEFQLYLSPINFDPDNPLFSISYPSDYSKKIASKLGLYYTQGMPNDTWSLTEGWLEEEDFLKQIELVFTERKNILLEELKKFKNGLFFFYFDTLDSIQHMFWRYIELKHPLYEENSPFKETIEKWYEKFDLLVGDVLKFVDENTILIILSDHGFSSFNYAVHLNSWLNKNGFLKLKEGFTESKEFFENIDWIHTSAYALGFGGIYINKTNREVHGIIKEDEVENIKKAIIEGLSSFKNPSNGEKVINRVYLKEEIFKGEFLEESYDLFVGFNPGYRASWQTALGGVPHHLIEENRKKWSGDHLIDPSFVPGVLFINKKIKPNDVSIYDIVPTIFRIFNISPDKTADGKSLF